MIMINLTKRENPCLCVSCACGSVFMATVLSSDYLLETEIQNELIQYAKDGYRFSVREAKDFVFESCKCNQLELFK